VPNVRNIVFTYDDVINILITDMVVVVGALHDVRLVVKYLR